MQIVYEHGGQCLVNAHIEEILVKGNKAVGVRVCKSSSWENAKTSKEKPETIDIFAKIIVNASGIYNLYHKLLAQDMPVVEEFKKTNKTIPSFGHNYLFVAIKGIFTHNIISYIFTHNIISYIFAHNIISYIFAHNIISYIFTHNIISYIFTHNNISHIFTHNNISYIFAHNIISYIFAHNIISYIFTHNNISYIFAHNIISYICS